MPGPDWNIKLPHAVAPIRGDCVQTLADARAYIAALAPGVRHQDDWLHAADLLQVAAESQTGLAIEQATFALERALFFHGLLAPRD
jgi:hypothetical protein